MAVPINKVSIKGDLIMKCTSKSEEISNLASIKVIAQSLHSPSNPGGCTCDEADDEQEALAMIEVDAQGLHSPSSPGGCICDEADDELEALAMVEVDVLELTQ